MSSYTSAADSHSLLRHIIFLYKPLAAAPYPLSPLLVTQTYVFSNMTLRPQQPFITYLHVRYNLNLPSIVILILTYPIHDGLLHVNLSCRII
jgi:hypothetical protein